MLNFEERQKLGQGGWETGGRAQYRMSVIEQVRLCGVGLRCVRAEVEWSRSRDGVDRWRCGGRSSGDLLFDRTTWDRVTCRLAKEARDLSRMNEHPPRHSASTPRPLAAARFPRRRLMAISAAIRRDNDNWKPPYDGPKSHMVTKG
ncbi:hypothetical protein LINPERHAP2_LOCUS18543 [Linum perenne]